MKKRINQHSVAAVIAVMAFLAAGFVSFSAQQRPAAQVAIGATDIGGLVASSKGPEAGVWVIAETTDLPTKFAKAVVTDDQGRYRSEERRVGKECRSRWS